MESLTESTWDVVIHGTGLHQSLLALALSRSGKKILHVDPAGYYGGPDAALTLQDADAWLATQADAQAPSLFRDASLAREGELSFPRAYALPLTPQIIHARSPLLSHLVSSRAFRQLEFLAVGAFYICRPGPDGGAATLTRIPSTREAVFSNAEIPPKAKRALMKFLKFVLDYEASENAAVWEARAGEPLDGFLASEFKLDEKLRSYVLTLTLAHSRISVRDGLAALSRHLTSTGVFGPGFAALYPKWGGASEVAQVACRAAAVGGAVYMLGTDITSTSQEAEPGSELEITLGNGVTVRSRALVRGDEAGGEERVERLVAVVDAPLGNLFEAVVEGSPTPAVAVVAFPGGSFEGQEEPVYVMAHSSDTGECPTGQSTLHLSTTSPTPILKNSLETLLSTLGTKPLYTLSYTQSQGPPTLRTEGSTLTLPSPRTGLAFDDGMLGAVRGAWEALWERWGGERGEFMVFEDREGVEEDEV